MVVIAALLLAACGGDNGSGATFAPANAAAEVDTLARNLTVAADAWRDDTDNREAAAAAQREAQVSNTADASPVPNQR